MSLKAVQIDIATSHFLAAVKDVLSIDAPEISVLTILSSERLIDCCELCDLLLNFNEVTNRVNRSIQSQIWRLVRSDKKTAGIIYLPRVDDRRPARELAAGISMPDLFLQLVWQFCSHHL